MAETGAQTLLESLKATLEPARERIWERHRQGAGGLEIVQAYCQVVDGALCQAFDRLAERYGADGIREGIALVCLGGYGRGELNPHSDIDIMFLVDGEVSEKQQSFISEFLALLWDLKFRVGHACRGLNDCLEIVHEDVVSANAMLEGRSLTGHAPLFEQFRQAVQEDYVQDHRAEFVRRKIENILERHETHERSQFQLEPDIKEGVGGLRDVHCALWIERVAQGIHTLDDLASTHVVDTYDLAALKVGYDFLLRVRTELHLLAGRKHDILDMNFQRQVTSSFGFSDTPLKPAVENFMSYYYLNVGSIRHCLNVVMERERQNPRIFKRLSGKTQAGLVPARFAVLGGKIFLEDYQEYFFAGEPGVRTLMRLMQAAQERGLTFSHHLCRYIRRSIPLVRLQLHYLKDAQQQFLELLRARGRVAPILRVMYETGLLGAILPEFEGITCLYQYDNYHQFTVDEHTLRVLEEAEALAETEDSELQTIREATNDIRRPEILRLSILLHDAGKAEGRAEHVRTGARLATRVCERLGLDPEMVRSVRFLVENHLLMSRMAHRRDLSDPQIIGHFSSTVGSPEMLRKLYVLTCADIRAVSRWAWTGWKGALLEDLYQKALISFDVGDAQEGADREDIRARLLSLVPSGVAEEAIDQHLRNVPERYIWECEPEEMAHHLQLISGLAERSFVTSMKRKTTVTELTICTTDRLGLFADITGTIAGAGYDVWGAQVFTREDGVIVDIFYLLDNSGDPVDPGRLDSLNTMFEEVFSGRKAVDELIRRQARRVVPGQRRPAAVHPPRVRIDNDSANSYTILDVYAHDRAGVLYQISRAISALGLDIHLAKIATHVDQILDVFYVTDQQGRKISDPRQLERIEASLREVLEKDLAVQ